MSVKSLIGLGNELPVKPLLTSAALVSRHQEDRPAFGI